MKTSQSPSFDKDLNRNSEYFLMDDLTSITKDEGDVVAEDKTRVRCFGQEACQVGEHRE